MPFKINNLVRKCASAHDRVNWNDHDKTQLLHMLIFIMESFSRIYVSFQHA